MVPLRLGRITVIGIALSWAIASCAPPLVDESAPTESAASTTTTKAKELTSTAAAVTAVDASATEENAATFAVTIQSPDTGCGQYANWWEVVTPDGELLYRRILVHSHVDEQPFTRSGGPVPVTTTQTVIVRAHMFPTGYGSQAMTGSLADGFEATTLSPEFAAELGTAEPQPGDCAY